MGVERSRIARRTPRERPGVHLGKFDLRFRPRPMKADVAYSFEVAEHTPKRLAERFVCFLVASAPTVVLTAASPGQGGHGHVNEPPEAYWVEAFHRCGLSPYESAQRAFMAALPLESLSGHWGKTNTFVFQDHAFS